MSVDWRAGMNGGPLKACFATERFVLFDAGFVLKTHRRRVPSRQPTAVLVVQQS